MFSSPQQNSGQVLGSQPFHELLMFGFELRIPCRFRDDGGAADDQALSDSLAHDLVPMKGRDEVCEFPPIRRKDVEWMGHGAFAGAKARPHFRPGCGTTKVVP
jgi:hypothetical protein